MIIAIDGLAGTGKRTIARAIAQHFRLPLLNTGMHYRAVGRQVVLNRGNVDKESDALVACQFPLDLLGEPELHSEMAAGLASRVAVHPPVRDALFARQKAFAERPGGAVLAGQDTGTVIAPNADVKLFLTASFNARVRRLFHEFLESEDPVEMKEIQADLAARDERDSNRQQAPLRAASDAVLLDTSELDRDAVRAEAIRLVESQLASRQAM